MTGEAGTSDEAVAYRLLRKIVRMDIDGREYVHFDPEDAVAHMTLDCSVMLTDDEKSLVAALRSRT